MGKERLAAFSDGVIAIIITIMVLELKVPEGASLASLHPLLSVLLEYALSFIYVGIYWNNHHHLLAVTERVNGAVLWANLHLLFWLSLIPFATAWVNAHQFSSVPTAVYGVLLLLTAIAFMIFQRTLITAQGPGSLLASAIGSDGKGKLSPFLYVVGIALAFARPWLADLMFVAVALIWLIPDSRIERVVTGAPRDDSNAPDEETDAPDEETDASATAQPTTTVTDSPKA